MNIPNHIKVLLAEDHMVVREGLCSLLNAEGDIEVVGQAQDGRQAVKLARQLLPAVIVMDIAMPRLNGLEATRQILKARPAAKVLILSAHSDEAYVQSAVDAGAVGFLVKQTSARDVCRAIREIQKGKTFFSPTIARRLESLHPRSLDRKGMFGKKGHQLTSREVEVLQLIAEGKANKETASELGISTKTVEKHRQALMGKLDIHDIASLTRYAIAVGIVESSVQLTIV